MTPSDVAVASSTSKAQLSVAQIPRSIALVGNPNAGKTTLFNRLTGLRAKTANFPGTTVERRVASVTLGGQLIQLMDLPGLYSLAAATPEERLARASLLGDIPTQPRPVLTVLIIDSTNLERNLYLASQILELGQPTVIALNMMDLAERSGMKIDATRLSDELGCPVVPVVARTGRGVDELREQIEIALDGLDRNDGSDATKGLVATEAGSCPFESRFTWAEAVGERCTQGSRAAAGERTERIDRVLTHPVIGVAAFMSVMFAVFGLIFWVAQYPMGWIDGLFGTTGALVEGVVPEGDLQSLLVEGVIGGVGGMLVFLPQICILFFFLALLEDTGYLARAAFVMDRLMRKVGLPGKAFVPLLSAHACAIPAIMSTRVIQDRRDRLVTILVAPLMTCSARIPVYAMVTALLFPDRPLMAATLFTGAYGLGIFAALGMAFVFKRTILKGESKPLVLELPSYKVPSLRNALITMYDRAMVFVKKAGTVILAISIVLWWLATYPKSEPPPQVEQMVAQVATFEAAGENERAADLAQDADRLLSRYALEHSFAGRLGKAIEPVIEPLGFDWQIGVGVVSSFAAREVIVSTLAVVYGVGADAADEDPTSLYDKLHQSTRADGSRVFTTATCVSLLVFYVLAMQCLPTQAVTRRETNTWRWPIFQLGYMTVLAYGASLATYQVLIAVGFG